MNENNFQFVGKIIFSGETTTVGNGFNIRTFVVEETQGDYPCSMGFSLIKDKVDLSTPVGSEVVVSYNPKCRESNGRWFTNLVAWRIALVQEAKSQASPAPAYEANKPFSQPQPTDATPQHQPAPQMNNSGDDLPF